MSFVSGVGVLRSSLSLVWRRLLVQLSVLELHATGSMTAKLVRGGFLSNHNCVIAITLAIIPHSLCGSKDCYLVRELKTGPGLNPN